jgi:hypothetical protein
MRIEIQLRIVADDNSVISEGEILQFDKRATETVGHRLAWADGGR